MKSIFFLVTAILIFSSLAYAHQPRIVAETSESNPYTISNPGISQAFYGQLSGSPAFFRLTSDKPFEFYMQVLAPYSQGYDANSHRISALVLTDSRKEIAFIYEDSYFWSSYFEESGNDYYFTGPEIKQSLPAGTYTIRLFNANNTGRYVLAVGTAEQLDVLNALVTVPVIKQNLFSQMIVENFFQLLGIITIAACAAVLVATGIVSKGSKENNRTLINFYGLVRYKMWAGFVVVLISWCYIYSQNTASIFGGLKTLVLGVMLVHWILYFFTSNGIIRKVQSKRALFTPKFLNHIVRGMIFQLVMVVLFVLLTAITI